MTELGGWHINTLTIENFRCFDRLKIDFDKSMTVLVGVNGAGKTSILDALAVMVSTVLREFEGPGRGFSTQDAREIPYDLKSESSVARMEPVYPVSGTVHGTLSGRDYQWSRTRSSAKGRTSWSDRDSALSPDLALLWSGPDESSSDEPLLPVIALYGVERLTGVRKASGAISRSRAGAYDAALDGKSDFSRLSSFIEALTMAEFVAVRKGETAQAASNQLRAITLACNAILAETGWRNPEWSPITGEIALTHAEHGTLPLSFMSSGTKIAAGLVIDLVSRMARANPSLGADDLLARVPGIVMIDEVELHLHPTWQQRILSGLQGVFPRVQFIVTTHSPQVLSTVDATSIRIIDVAEVRGAEYAAGLRSDIILERILGTRSEPPLDINRNLDRYMDLVEAGEGETASTKKLREKLDEELGGVNNVPRLADADAFIAFYDLDD
ncbi:AAA family ATPase [Arthrobacter cryoconiti]|uniref:AAA family ATPase n=1 Tax=Arthrobacter cryoconiti TaxID=748907 RepID=A0ABV8R3R9_9MICC|nr:AAA family ATPase [Arthrobacter cryoconiti]MCC9066745.1 AAA family ATPase [Arthrobacter cryoconiti]